MIKLMLHLKEAELRILQIFLSLSTLPRQHLCPGRSKLESDFSRNLYYLWNLTHETMRNLKSVSKHMQLIIKKNKEYLLNNNNPIPAW